MRGVGGARNGNECCRVDNYLSSNETCGMWIPEVETLHQVETVQLRPKGRLIGTVFSDRSGVARPLHPRCKQDPKYLACSRI